MMALKCQLIDYEVITDDTGRRLIFFGRHAGLAGMIDTLWAFGRRLEWEGFRSAFADVRMAHEYGDLEEAKSRLAEIAGTIREDGLPSELPPLICGFAGYGNVSSGAQEIFDIFPHDEIMPSQLIDLDESGLSGDRLYKVVFKEEDLVEPVDRSMSFELQDYYDNPEKYRSRFEDYLDHLSILVNCIYWEERYPRLVTLDYLKGSYTASAGQRLKVIGDISCDIGGSIQCAVKATDPGDPVYVYEPLKEEIIDGVKGEGPVIMAVDNLPCELAKESSEFFGEMLLPFIPDLAGADYSVPFERLKLPGELHGAVILHNGELTPKYRFMKKYL
jgi:alpha-aminoadipic semialdehyde synthase